MKKSYILKQDYSFPDVISTPSTYQRARVNMKKFRRGEIVNGEMKHSNNEPSFVLVEGRFVIPVSMLREVVTKEVSSNASGFPEQKAMDKKPALVVTRGGLKGLDAMLIGALSGVAGVFIAEKQTWLQPSPNKKNYIYGAVVGALAGLYLNYRFKK